MTLFTPEIILHAGFVFFWGLWLGGMVTWGILTHYARHQLYGDVAASVLDPCGAGFVQQGAQSTGGLNPIPWHLRKSFLDVYLTGLTVLLLSLLVLTWCFW